jgi:hypothetical protein
VAGNDADLGFSYRTTRSGGLDISRDGRVVTRLHGKSADKAIARLESASFEAQQQLLARLTGNYRRGNERQARSHERNHS